MIIYVDAHLPASVSTSFEQQGAKVIHTSGLISGNATPDSEIANLAAQSNGVVVTKDIDFYHSFMLKRIPPKLVLVKFGNARLAEVRKIFATHAAEILELLHSHDLVELYKDRLVAVE